MKIFDSFFLLPYKMVLLQYSKIMYEKCIFLFVLLCSVKIVVNFYVIIHHNSRISLPAHFTYIYIYIYV